MNRLSVTFLCGGLLLAAISPVARADIWNKKTIVDFPKPVEVPGAVLQPGKYVLKLVDSASNRNIVQVSNERGNHVYATILARPNYRLQPAGKTVLTFYEMSSGQPEALQAWFYPGDNYGQEFAYPKHRAMEIAQVTHQDVPTTPSGTESGTATQPAQATSPEPPSNQASAAPETPQSSAMADEGTAKSGSDVAEVQAPPAQPAQLQPQAQEQLSTPPSTSATDIGSEKKMPATASNTPAVALIGLLSIGAAFAVRAFANRRLS